jgi:hypothetical protein
LHTIKLWGKSLPLNRVNAKIIHATQKKLLTKMWIIWTYEKYLCMVQLKNVLYNKFIDSHLWFIFLHNTTSCTCRLELFLVFRLSRSLFRLHFHRKGKTSKSLLVASHFEFLTTFGTLDATFANTAEKRLRMRQPYL